MTTAIALIPGCVELTPRWLLDADTLFQQAQDTCAWRQEHITIQGQRIALPRMTAWHGDKGYRYSGIANTPQPWTPVLQDIRERLGRETGVSFNSVLCNWYRTGRDSVAWHSDDEVELGTNPVIASISLGATRTFSLKRRDGAGARLDQPLAHGDLLVMRGSTQRDYLHQVPKTTKPVGDRINLTFRLIR